MSAPRTPGRSRAPLAWLAFPLLALAGCEGSGSSGGGLVIEDEVLVPPCTPVAGAFPPGFTVKPGNADRAALVRSGPDGVAIYRLDSERPRELTSQTIPTDSDMDGVDDDVRSQQEGFFPLLPFLGAIHAPGPDLGLVSASNYEEVLFFDLNTAGQVGVMVENPVASGSFDPNHYPFLPPAGETHLRTAVSTRACVFPPLALDSNGNSIGPEARCDPGLPGYFTNLTAGKAVAAGHLFVATSNLRNSGSASFYPGTVLVYEWDEIARHIRPDVETPLLFTTGFNPTAVTGFVTASGREVALVTVTGAIGIGTGAGNSRTPASIDVIDAQRLRLAASIPLGLAGPSFDELAIDPSGRVALLGASSQRQLYAVDLAPLDDPRLYEGNGAPILLDGLTAGFPDARIFSADHPLVLPDRSDGPPASQCEGFTHTAINAAGSEAFATDHCDGTLTRIRLDLSSSPPVPVPADRFQVLVRHDFMDPLNSDGLLRAPGPLRIRPGAPSVDYNGPDVLVTVGLPDAQFCGVRVEAQ